MYYKKLSFAKIAYSESDRLSLFNTYGNIKRMGYGLQYPIHSNSPNYIQCLSAALPIFSESYTVHRTIKNSNDMLIAKTHVHTDNRPAALNIPISNCGPGCDTVFYDTSTLTHISLPNLPSMNNSQLYLSNNLIETDRFTLTMDAAYLVNTLCPHARIQTTSNDRLFLSMNLRVSFEQAVEYFS